MEKTIEIDGINPVELFGINNDYLNLIKSFYPKLKILARGNRLTVIGDEATVEAFQKRFQSIINYYLKFNQLTENAIEQMILGNEDTALSTNDSSDVIVYGNNGLKIKAKTANQVKLVKAVTRNSMVFAVGPAGTGKTYTAVALAVRAFKNKEVRRIILTRPAVEAGENLGFLPGDLKEKLDPYMMPLYDALRDMIPPEKLQEMLELGIIEIAPLAFMRGRTLDKAFVILDEAQNTTIRQMKMFLTRMGQTAKFVITGDKSQVDLPYQQKSGLVFATKILSKVKGIEIIQLDENDVIRHPLVKRIIDAFDKAEAEDEDRKFEREEKKKNSKKSKE